MEADRGVLSKYHGHLQTLPTVPQGESERQPDRIATERRGVGSVSQGMCRQPERPDTDASRWRTLP